MTYALLLAACTRDVVPETTARVAFRAPAWGDTLSGTGAVVVMGTGVPSVTVASPDVPIGAGELPLALSWDSTTVVDGNHRLRAAGAGAEAEVEVWVRNGARAPDDVRLVQPSDGATVCGMLVVEASVADDVETVTFLLDGAEQHTAAEAPWRWEWAVTPGEHRIGAHARFEDGGEMQRSVWVEGADIGCSPSPYVTIRSPEFGAWTASDVALEAQADGDVQSVAWFVDDGLYERVSAAPWTAIWDVAAFAEGTHTLRAVATSSEGEGRAEVRVGIDRTPPSVRDLDPEEGSRVAGVVPLGANVEDALGLDSVQVFVDDELICSSSDAGTPCSWDTNGVAFGPHTVRWSARDRAGNGAEASVLLTVDNPPDVAWVSPSAGATLTGVVMLDTHVVDDEGIASARRSVDGVVVGDEWDTCAEAPGPHTLVVEAADLGGQVVAASIEVTTDQPFEVALLADAVLIPGSPLAAITTNDRAVARVDWDIDGTRVARAVVGDADPACGLSCPDLCRAWAGAAALAGIADGPGLLTVTAVDVGGDVAVASALVDVRIDADLDGYVTTEAGGDDCDDASSGIHPGMAEICDGVDQDCDGVVDQGFDADGDGHLDATACVDGDDCDDADASVSPSVVSDLCDGRDENCDGWSDYGVSPTRVGVVFGDGTDAESLVDNVFGNAVTVEEDSVLTEVSMYLDPTVGTVTTLVVFDSVGLSTWTRTASAPMVGDGAAGWYTAAGLSIPLLASRSYLLAVEAEGVAEVYLDPYTALASEGGITPLGAFDASRASAEFGDDPLIADPDPGRLAWQEIHVDVLDAADVDADRDGLSAWCGDCDDDDPEAWPGASEACDGKDGDCSGSAADEADADEDGWRLCEADCDDGDPNAWPGASEACDGIDQDCDGAATDEEDGDGDGVRVCGADCDDADPTVGAGYWFLDADGDGAGDPAEPASRCPPPVGYVSNADDCDDGAPHVYAGASEDCDGADNDCDGAVDEGWDADGDGWPACEECDDGDPTVRPDATDLCGDAVDDDCDGVALRCRPAADLTVADAGALLIGEDTYDYAGWAMAGGEDLDGDGYTDVVLSATGDDDGGRDAGAFYLVRGPITATLDLSLADAKRWNTVAHSGTYLPLAVGGDLDLDGVSDALMGIPGISSGAGGAYAWSGDVTGRRDTGDAFLTIGGDGATGKYVAMADLDADGAPEALLSSNSTNGYVYVFSPPLTGSVSASAHDGVFIGEDSGDGAGQGVCRAGDVDGDGIADLFIGAGGDDDAASNSGAVYVVMGGSIGSVDLSTADGKVLGEDAAGYVGSVLAGAQDVNGDGLDDLLVGRPTDADGGTTAGAVWLVLAPFSGVRPLTGADAKVIGRTGTYAGNGVAGPGDVDGDGFAEILIGAPLEDEGATNAGGAWLLYGPVAGTANVADVGVLISGAAILDQVGTSVAAAGDLDGDGGPDFLLNAPGLDNGGVYVFGGAF